VSENSGIHTNGLVLQNHEFIWIKDYLYKNTGIVLNENKKALVMGRLEKRLRYHHLKTYTDYFRLFDAPGFETETAMAIDLLTTNETYFFREPKHFEYLVTHILPNQTMPRPFRIWSAASSSGEEAYTLAMLLADFGKLSAWEIMGSDISTRILEKARRGLYPIAATEKIPSALLKKYCLKGRGEFDGFLLMDPQLGQRLSFRYLNLIEKLPVGLGLFDVIFLRNVMIYFDVPTKQRLLQQICEFLRPGAYLFVSHSESLNGMRLNLQTVAASIYRKPLE
jgi:chemotaxis protein methyltransferase CheR